MDVLLRNDMFMPIIIHMDSCPLHQYSSDQPVHQYCQKRLLSFLACIVMARKTDYYLSQCAIAASKSSMTYHLGAVLVKGGKVISTGHNHHRTHYDGNDILKHGHRKPTSMHAEMHAIFSLTGMSPSFKQQVQLSLRRTAASKRRPRFETCCTQAGCDASTQRRVL